MQFGVNMSNLSIKDVPEAWAESLRQRAARNHRSLQGELMAIIEQAVAAGADTEAYRGQSLSLDRLAVSEQQDHRQGRLVGYDRRGNPIMRFGWKTVEQLVAEMKAARGGADPAPQPGIPLGVDIIREDRDSR
jgi:plasmid stability protein